MTEFLVGGKVPGIAYLSADLRTGETEMKKHAKTKRQLTLGLVCYAIVGSVFWLLTADLVAVLIGTPMFGGLLAMALMPID